MYKAWRQTSRRPRTESKEDFQKMPRMNQVKTVACFLVLGITVEFLSFSPLTDLVPSVEYYCGVMLSSYQVGVSESWWGLLAGMILVSM